MKTIEEKAARAILQKKSIAVIGGQSYKVSNPTTATLIEVSRLISTLPPLKLKDDDIVTSVMANAKDCKVIGEIVATIIRGVKAKSWLDRFHVEEKQIDKLADKILTSASPKEINTFLIERLREMELADFFAFTTSLSEVNILKKTR